MIHLSRRALAAALFAAILLPSFARSSGNKGASAGAPATFVAPVPALTLPANIGGGASTISGGGVVDLKITGWNAPVLPNVNVEPSHTISSPVQGITSAGAQKLNASSPVQPGDAAQPGQNAQNNPVVPDAENIPATGEVKPETATEQVTTAANTSKDDGSVDVEITVEEQKQNGDQVFDGVKKSSLKDSVYGVGRFLGAKLVGSKVAGLLPHTLVDKMAKSSGVPTPPAPQNTRDIYGGPKHENMTFKQRMGFGLKWGLNLLGISSILQFTLAPLMKTLPWQLHVSDGILGSMGRVELMTSMGPAAIGQGLATSPISFLFFSLPVNSMIEEITFRGLQFGLLFLALAAIRPVARFISGKIADAPDLFGFRSIAQRILGDGPNVTRENGKVYLGVQRISSMAYPIAAGWAALQFAFAHFAAWGANPYFFAVHLTLGLGLTFVAYKTRSLFASAMSHFVVNALPLVGIALAMMMGSLITAQIYSIALAIGSIGFLFWSWRKHLKDKRLLGGGSALMALIIAGSLGFAGMKTTSPGDMAAASRLSKAVPTWTVQQAQDTTKNEPAPTDATGKTLDTVRVIANGTTVGGPKTLLEHGEDLADLTAKVKPAVAKVVFKTQMGSGSGSGFVVRKEGLLVTNAHVTDAVGIGGTVTIEFADGTSVEGKVVAMNTDRDIAFVQLPPKKDGWATLAVGDTNKVREGQFVMALGHPLGLPFSTSFGVVSGLGGGRGSIYVQQLQTDAAVNHGNSGGPLVNMNGEVIAINTAIAAPTPESGSIGIGFSITAEFINAALKQYDATGNINSSYMGIIVDTSDPMAPAAGVRVEQVRPGSAAAKAGLRAEDVIMGARDEIFGPQQPLFKLARAMATLNPGDTMKIAVLRDGAPLTLTITLEDKE